VRRAFAVASVLLAGAAATYAWRVLDEAATRVVVDASGRHPPRLSVTALPRPEGASGAALDVAARDGVLASAWEDGSVAVRAGDGAPRLARPPEGDGFRRVAVGPGGEVTAITKRGRLFAVEDGAARDLRARVEANSRIAAGVAPHAVWAAGEPGGLRAVDLVRGTRTDVWDSGGPPVTALRVGSSRAWAGDVTGAVEGGTLDAGGRRRRLETGARVTAVDATWDGWLAAGDEAGHVHLAREADDGPGGSTRVEGAVAGLVLLPAVARAVTSPPLLVVHEPRRAVLLDGASLSPLAEAELPATPRAACGTGDGVSALVATDAGEVLVRVEPPAR
jgi:hypothetical protein